MHDFVGEQSSMGDIISSIVSLPDLIVELDKIWVWLDDVLLRLLSLILLVSIVLVKEMF